MAPVSAMDSSAHSTTYTLPCTNTNTSSPVVSTLPTLCGKPANPAPISRLVPSLGDPQCSPPSGTAGHSSPSGHLSGPSGTPSFSCPPVPSPNAGPLIPPNGHPIPPGSPAPPTCPPVATSSAPLFHGIDLTQVWVQQSQMSSQVMNRTWHT